MWQGSWLIPIFKCEQAKLAHLTAAKRILSGQKDINGTGGRRWLELFNCAKFNQKENLEGCESLEGAAENIQADTRVFFPLALLCVLSLYISLQELTLESAVLSQRCSLFLDLLTSQVQILSLPRTGVIQFCMNNIKLRDTE